MPPRHPVLMTGLSGSLEAPDMPRLLPFAPDFLGFRGALCSRSQRTASIDAQAVAQIRALIPEERQEPGSGERRLPPAGGPRLCSRHRRSDARHRQDLRARFRAAGRIGAYSFEHGHTQKVRFDVTADVLRVTKSPEDMRHVFSYDIIMDGIRTIVARGHVELSEALAEAGGGACAGGSACHAGHGAGRKARARARRRRRRDRTHARQGVAVGCQARRAVERREGLSRPRQEGRHLVVRQAVVKLGGSTANQARDGRVDRRAGVIQPAARRRAGRRAVRRSGARRRRSAWAFPTSAAHAMAILAMEQFGQIVLDRQERLVPARSLDEIERAQQDGKVPVWLPSALAIPAPDIPRLLGHHLGFACGVDCRQARRRGAAADQADRRIHRR